VRWAIAEYAWRFERLAVIRSAAVRVVANESPRSAGRAAVNPAAADRRWPERARVEPEGRPAGRIDKRRRP
jgi:hypothetical protein